MRNGQYGWLILFTSLCMGVIFFSLGVSGGSYLQSASRSEENGQESGAYWDYFKKIKYYYFLWGEEEKRFHLSADELQNNIQTRKIVFLKPEGSIHLQQNRTLFYRGERGFFESKGDELHLRGQVHFSEGDSSMSCSRAIYGIEQKELKLRGNVVGLTRLSKHPSTIRISSGEALAQLLLGKVRYFGGVKGNVESFRIKGEKLLFSSEVLNMDLHRYRLDIIKDVVFRRDRFVAEGNRGEIFWSRHNKSVEHYLLHDNVKLKEKVASQSGDSFFEREAWAEKLEGVLNDNRVVLTGRPRVVQMEDVIKGNRIVLKKDSAVVEVYDANANFKLR